jgi:hypothetical protein
MSWEDILKRDFTKKPNGVRIDKDGFTDNYKEVAMNMRIPFARKLHESLKRTSPYESTYQTKLGKELEDIAQAMSKLGINITFAKLIDEKYNFEDNPDGDGLYEHDVKGGVATKVKYKGIEKILYFVIYSEGAYTEMGDKPIFRIPRVLEDEEVFTDTVLESLKIGEGSSKDPSGNDDEDDRERYANWYYSLSRREREEMADEGFYPPPSMYGREKYGKDLKGEI